MRNTLQAYTAPSAICKITPAAAIVHRFGKTPPFAVIVPAEDIYLPSLNACEEQTKAPTFLARQPARICGISRFDSNSGADGGSFICKGMRQSRADA